MLFRTKRTEVKIPAPNEITLHFLGTVDVQMGDEFESHGAVYICIEIQVDCELTRFKHREKKTTVKLRKSALIS